MTEDRPVRKSGEKKSPAVTHERPEKIKRRSADIDNFYVLWLNSQESKMAASISVKNDKPITGKPLFTDSSNAHTFIVWDQAYKQSEPIFVKLREQARDGLILRIAGQTLSYLMVKYESYRGKNIKKGGPLDEQTVVEGLTNKFAKFLKNETFLMEDNIWEDFCNWFGTHLTDWVLEEMEREIGSEKMDGMNKKEMNGLFYDFISNNLLHNKVFVSNFTRIVNEYTQKWIEEIVKLMRFESFSLEKIEEILGIQVDDVPLIARKDITWSIIEQGNLLVMSNTPYQRVREAMSNDYFKKHTTDPWPVAELQKSTIEGVVQLKPVGGDCEATEEWLVNKAWKQHGQLSELTVDVYDALCGFFLSKARHHKDFVEIQLDDLLTIRGIKPKLSGNGRRGGFEADQRQQILEALSIVQSLWIDLKKAVIYEKGKAIQMQLRGRAFVFKDFEEMDIGCLNPVSERKLVFSVDEVFAKYLYGSGRQVAFLPIEALRYNPYRENWEKKLLRYLSWRWRTQARKGDFSQPHKVSTLLEMIGKEMNERTPSRTRDRLEQALDTLLTDGVIASWHYEKWDESIAAAKGWGRIWENTTILIEPPEIIIDHYRPIERNPKNAAKFEKSSSGQKLQDPASIYMGQKVKKTRTALALSLLQAAEEMEISTSYLSSIERELKIPSAKVIKRITAWLEKYDLANFHTN